jgi:hypothetical protein
MVSNLGLFRKDIKIDFISRLYFKGIMGIRDLDTFPTKLYDPVSLKQILLNTT